MTGTLTIEVHRNGELVERHVVPVKINTEGHNHIINVEFKKA